MLNVGELTGMLGSGDITVGTGGIAKDIQISAALSWANTSRLTLDADRSLIVKQPVTVAGSGALTLSSNGGHQKVDLEFFGKGSVQFWDLSSNLVINGKSYTLVGDIAALAADIAANPSGSYALARPYDASADGTYGSSPIPTTFEGTFEGLGNAFLNLKVQYSPSQSDTIGLFAFVNFSGEVRNAILVKTNAFSAGDSAGGALVGINDGIVSRSRASGVVRALQGQKPLGGLVGANSGTISSSHADVKTIHNGASADVGGLVGYNQGVVERSYADGAVKSGASNNTGGLVGDNQGLVENSFSTSLVHEAKSCCTQGNFGGLVGKNETAGRIASSYAAGTIGQKGNLVTLGGLVGFDGSQAGNITTSYWDLDMGVGDPSQGAGNIPNDQGITGLTTVQLQSELPQGFDPHVWGEDPNINNGLPYLLALESK
ncbi:MAG TPA: GLUG motif-containing protein [Rhizomicrobium sp.]